MIVAGVSLIPAYLRAYSIGGASEVPTVVVGDQIIVNNAAFALQLPYLDERLFPQRVVAPQERISCSYGCPTLPN